MLLAVTLTVPAFPSDAPRAEPLTVSSTLDGRTVLPTRSRWLAHPSVLSSRVDEVDFLRSEEKYTLIGLRDQAGAACEAIIRTPLKDLVAQLDPEQFVQVHRSVVVNLRSISHVTRGANETAEIHLKNRGDVLPVSRNYLHLFKQM